MELLPHWPMLEEAVDRFVEEYLAYDRQYASGPKFFHDPIWGTIALEPYEAALIDTPLLQRLRQIHQTGAVYYTFGSAHHTRFDHTVGVIHVAGRMIDALKNNPETGALVDERSTQKVRFAALMHDTGHAAFSHTSEEVYSLCDDIQEFKRTNSRFYNSGAGEILSYLITTSKSFRGFFSDLRKNYPQILVDVDDFALLMTGKPTDVTKIFEAEVISGPFDADKLDYFPRDGRSAGIQLAFDFDRLLHCIELAEIPRQIDNQSGKTWSLVVNRGGFNPIQQLLFARATLFSTVYHHHKVRACDSMVKGCFEFYRENQLLFKRSESSCGYALSNASDYLYITDYDFFAEAALQKKSSYTHKSIHAILYRRLAKRVLTISTRTIDGFGNGDSEEDTKIAYFNFLRLQKDQPKLRTIAKEIIANAGIEVQSQEVWLDLPLSPSFDKAGRARIRIGEKDDKDSLVDLAKFIPVEQWVNTYNQYYAQVFLFGPIDAAKRLALAQAAIKLFESRFGLRFKPLAFPKEIRRKLFPIHKPNESTLTSEPSASRSKV